MAKATPFAASQVSVAADQLVGRRERSMIEVRIRRATVDDIDGVAALFDGYRHFYQQPRDLDGARQFLKARIDAGDSVILVAEREQQLAGFTQLYPSFSSVSMRRVWILNDLFVDPQHRRYGLGQALLNAAETFARESNSKGLVLATQKENAPAKTLYETREWKLDVTFDHYYRYFSA
jgi:GNAT superfamily N-acetyltransferase